MAISNSKRRVLTRGISATAMAAATLLAGGAVMLPTLASAQVSTASLSGQVTGADGSAAAGAQVTARSIATNQTFRAVSDANGGYALNGLRPGEYEVTATAGTETVSQNIVVGVGEAASLDLAVGGAAATAPTEGSQIVVTGTRLRETRTSEVATNVSTTQIERLPQTDRNFLAFAALAPGVRYNDSETDKGITSGASTASQVNVFIDGVSLKNQLREGGIAGQQNSRGNPFGQLAVQEFRVLTQNYKAEYEQAGAAIVTAITKSGTNEFHGEIFGQYTDKSLSEKSYLDKRNNRAEPAFERKQYGAALGGPIIKDKLFFFGAYEGNDQDRAFNVVAGGTPALRAAASASLGRDISTLEGAFVSPFRSDFYFGKLTLTPDDRQTFDLSFSRRDESDIQGFGNQTSYEAAENKKNRVDTYQFKWAYNGSNFVNEFNASYLNYTFNPTSLHPELPQYEYAGVIIAGGKDSTRRETQNSYTFRNDFTYSGIAGHVFKAGVRVQVTDITFDNQAYVQPHYTFVSDPGNNLSFAFPSEARLGLGNSLIQASNTQVGVYVQDDWNLTPRLQLNLGVRWDYETNGFNNEYVTPASAAAALRSLPKTYYFDPENYITDGHDRKPFTGAFAPRVGFSYDLKGDRSTVIFGGWGRYYDRNNFNNTVDELSRVLNPIGVFRFSTNGAPRSGLPTVAWNPSYLTREGLIALRASAAGAGLPELFAVKNDAKPPVNDQFSLGVRQRIGVFQASITGSYQRGRNGYTNLFATRQNNGLGNCCNTSTVVPYGYANVLIGYDGLDTRYKALFVTLDKNYTKSSGWGLNIAYTLSKAEQNGNDLFSLDGITPDAYGWRARPGDERHRVVISGMVDLPLGFSFSTVTQLGSGQAYQVTDATQGFDTGKLRITSAYPEKNCIEGLFAFCEVNLTLANRFKINGIGQVEAAVDILNAFNNKNFKDFDGFFSATDPLDPGRIGNNTITLPRRIQFRLGYKF
ncbi:outer membrane receptor protein involved in Fe transport [Sphingomonas kyeonggiensis]|uniref:Outer membrane receptor protein involved in Fe transport n=1 Tax=Sphingomonas kyeonggiensis TaxID=1268553 RepID=A0A7W7K432_9SPHN|nr:TonB-dependent receptor [Sphingomonas kyeonggiensis]MBB4840674.1 outer membrane receptor protein involved in Fe transport [Sphingomonas kyeonggiensis]